MDSIETFDEQKNLARVTAGFKGGMMFTNPAVAPIHPIKEGLPETSIAKLQGSMPAKSTPIDPWVFRYPGSKAK